MFTFKAPYKNTMNHLPQIVLISNKLGFHTQIGTISQLANIDLNSLVGLHTRYQQF